MAFENKIIIAARRVDAEIILEPGAATAIDRKPEKAPVWLIGKHRAYALGCGWAQREARTGFAGFGFCVAWYAHVHGPVSLIALRFA